jgi:eukaryotic-like serine/threonine-protein kinase
VNESQIFTNALKLGTAAERAAYLDAACAGEPGLRAAVEELLRAQANDPDFLERPAAVLTATAADPAAAATAEIVRTDRPGVVLAGRYKLLEEIGEGGMGTVWMAQQTEPVKRLVAVKLIKAGMDSEQVIARFEAERQALALMDHPNIAKVFDAGVTPDGRPFFVMELVKGVPITKYCDEHHLTPRQRLELFGPVCQAIQHAHQKGVIHRDIKPSNVLVALYDDRPVPKVIDFGVAKATGQPLTEQTLHTGFGAVVGTVEYMSPEQATFNQLDVDTRSDVYSLGVLLYELLAGSPPFSKKDLERAGMLEMLRVIREQEPSKPSTKLSSSDALPTLSANRGTEPARLTRLVRGELDWIVMKALEKDRNRRYETATGFAMDVQRYLADEPVQACPPSLGYRFRKFARRNRRPVLAAAIVLLTLIGGIIGTTYGLVRAQQARRAETARAESEARAKQEAQAREAEAKAVLDFLDTKVFAAARPVGDGLGLGHDVTLRRAVETAVPFVAQSFSDQPLIEARLRLTLGTSFLYLGEAKVAAEQYSAARLLYTKHLGPKHPDTLKSMHNLAKSLDFLGRPADAAKLREEVLALRKVTLGLDHPDTLESMHHQATSYLVLGRYNEALALYEQALARRKVVLGPHHRESLWSMNGLANTYFSLGRHAEALKLHEETLELRKAYLGADHPDTLYSMYHIADVQTALGRHDEALILREQTLAKRKTVLGADHRDTLASMSSVAFSYATAGRDADAIKLREKEVTLRKAKLGPDHPDTRNAMKNLASLYRKRGTRLRHGSHFREAARDFEKVTELNPDDYPNWYDVAGLHLYLGDVEHYRRDCREMLDRFENVSEEKPEIAVGVAMVCSLEPGSVPEASRVARLAQRCVAGMCKDSDRRWSLLAMALTEYRAGHHQQAIEWLNRFAPRANGTDCDGGGFAILAMAHYQLGQADAARTSLDAVRAILAKRPKDAMPDWGWRDWLHAQLLSREAEEILKREAGFKKPELKKSN